MQRRLGINPGKDPLSIITELMSDSLIESEKMSNGNIYFYIFSELILVISKRKLQNRKIFF